jgi:hypothetical protein
MGNKNRGAVLDLLRELKQLASVQTAAQQNHDLTARRPSDGFRVIAIGTPTDG